ncbi:hypothetical protein LOC68_08575 [Blastopirellula sp. JC732]|uniref:Uncharacterized protein n=1 Tax=Blastopirellula sediminis TaxID=2894196 RepID=A0A9X1MJV9_9BACT|nr:hypothetical protein [Blastopirellula sediminis]MCC9608775.1 hypothetical protein [Blastopirellula sediminis]MCC9628448.1 hypothetical protein [Blastopirellula sediminis]
MRRFVSILLIFLLVGQSLAAAPHWHGEETGCDTEEHAARPHVHLHGEKGHHHEHASQAPEPEPVEHDSDAVFLTADDAVIDNVSTSVPKLTWSWFSVCPIAASSIQAACKAETRYCLGWDSPLRPSCARYEQLLSIRC